jgi:hypothetical protein
VGFVLLPSYGTRSILLGLSAALLVLAGVVWSQERKLAVARPQAAAAVIAVSLMVALFSGLTRPATASTDKFRLLRDEESLYGRVRVIDDDARGLRWMLVDASAIGAQFKGTDEPPFQYLYALETLGEFRPQAKTALVIGLGAGYLPGALAKQGLQVDTIEIDPKVVEAAREYFGFVPPGDLIVGDARYEVRRLTKRYDIVIHDCFTGGEMPWHLFSAEMLEVLKGRLNDGGILAMNFFGLQEGRRVEALSVVAGTLDARFRHRLTLAPAPGHELFDRLMLVSDAPLSLPTQGARRKLSVGGAQAFEKLPTMVTTLEAAPGGLIVTDDYNPLESLQLRKSEAYRRLTLERFGVDLLSQ